MFLRDERPAKTSRLAMLVLGLVVLAVFLVALVLTPDSRGFGTHEQLGFPPCQFRALTGLNCPHCGMTTGFAYFVRGQFLQAWQANPGSLVLAPLLLAAAIWCLVVAGSGRWWGTAEPTRWIVFGGIGYLLTALLLWVMRLL